MQDGFVRQVRSGALDVIYDFGRPVFIGDSGTLAMIETRAGSFEMAMDMNDSSIVGKNCKVIVIVPEEQ